MDKLYSPLKVSLFLQFFSYFLGVPLAATILAIIMNYDHQSFIYFCISVVFGVSCSLVIFPIRYLYIKKLLNQVFQPSEATDYKKLKISLLKYPYLDSFYIVQATWCIGVSTFWMFYSFLKGRFVADEWPMLAVYAVVFFINSTAQFFIAEWVLGQYLTLPQFANIHLARDEYPKMSLSVKIFMTAFSVAWYFLLIIVYVMYAIYAHKIEVHMLGIYFLPVIFILGTLLALALAFFFSKSIQNSMLVLQNDLNNLANGKLLISSPLINTDQTGDMSFFVTGIQNKLLKTMQQIHREAASLENASKLLSNMSQSNLESIKVQSDTTKQISQSLSEIHGMMKTTSEKSQYQRQASQDVHSYLASLEDKINLINGSSVQAEERSESAKKQVHSGQSIMRDTKDTMQQIRLSTEKISNIITIINDLADQIGLLSLNASIEAARAAEKGKGFSVVAQEVSKLGDTTNQNAKEVSQLVKSSSQNAKNGEDSIGLTEKNFVSIGESVSELDRVLVEIKKISDEQLLLKDSINSSFATLLRLSEEISFAAVEEEKTLFEVNSSLTLLGSKTENIHNSSEEAFQVANRLLMQAKSLKSEISKFEIE